MGNLARLRYRETTMTAAVCATVAVAVGLFPGWTAATTGLRAEVTAAEFAAFLAVAAFAGAVKGLVGFGYVTIVTPVLALMIDPTVAVIVLSIPPWVLNVYQVGETRSGVATVREEWRLIGLGIIGSAIGVFVLSKITLGALLLFCIGLLMLGYVAFQVLRGFVTVRAVARPRVRGAVGFATGLTMAATNVGTLFPMYVHTFERDADRYVGLLSVFFLAILSERIVQMSIVGMLTPYRLWLGATIAVVTLVGIGIGSVLRRFEIDERRFNWLIVTVLLIIGLNILRETVPVLLG